MLRPGLRAVPGDVAEFCRENVHFLCAKFEGSDSIGPESLSITFPSNNAERRFSGKALSSRFLLMQLFKGKYIQQDWPETRAGGW
jgi:hypothetical protein